MRAAVLTAAPDVVLVQSEAVTASLMAAGGKFAVVFVHVADPVGSGLVGGLARPEGRLTGLVLRDGARQDVDVFGRVNLVVK